MNKPTFEVHLSLKDDDKLDIEVEIKEIDFEDIIVNFMHISDLLSQAVEMSHKEFLQGCMSVVDAFEKEKRSDMN